jgi:pyruvate dehydrogenase E2 component (dihydrolipoyllysine-residue acetyltransferase)
VIGDAGESADSGGPAAADAAPAGESPAAQPEAGTEQPAAQPVSAEQPVAEQAAQSEPAPQAPPPPQQDGAPAYSPPSYDPDRPDVASGHPSPGQSGDAAAAPAAAPPAAAAPAAAPPTAVVAAPFPTSGGTDDDAGGPYVTPLVRKLASERGVDLASVRGTGIGGRIRKSDVLAAAAGAQSAPPAAPPATPQAPPAPAPSSPSAPPAAPPAAPPPAPTAPAASVATAAPTQAAPAAPRTAPPAEGLRGRVVPMSRMRQVIAARMVESLQVAAQLTTVMEVDVTKIARLREHAKAGFEAREGVKLSFLPFFAVAAVEALKAHPVVNASIDVEAKTITYHDAEHLGIAVDTERGLAVPVIHNAGDLNLGGIARKIADLAERTRGNRVSPDELGGGTFTLTNTGSRGALFDTPIINQPQVAILGTGAVVRRPMVIADAELGETIAIRSMVYLALSYDHRIVDGADAARFLATMKERLEAGAFERALGLG